MEYELQLYSLNEVRNKLGYETVPYIMNENNVYKCYCDDTARKIQHFMKYEMVESNDRDDDSRVISHIIFNQDNKPLGFFSHFIKKLPLRDIDNICKSKEIFYITCLARFEGISNKELNVKEILDLAFGIFYQITRLTGGINTVVLDTENIKLKALYIDYGFSEVPACENVLQMMMS